ncbi:MAG: hypothetical protein ACRBFS_02300 [Aureispira sp.]
MQKTKILFLALFAVLAIMACRKDDPNTNTGGTTGGSGTGGGTGGGGGQQGEMIANLGDFWESQKQGKIQQLTATAGQYTELTGAQGTKVTIYSNSLLLNGAVVTGSVDIDLIEAYDKGDMLLMGLNTMGRDNFGNYRAMISAGEFFFSASQNGQALDINPNSPIQIATAAFPSADFNNDMIPLLLEEDTIVAGDSVWVPIDSVVMGNCQDSFMISLGQSNYCFQIGSNSRWTNCDYFANWGTALTGMTVNLPTTHDGVNTKVYISFDGLNLLTNLRYNSGGVFTLGSNYRVPVGQAVHLVVVAEQNGVLVHNIQALTVANNQTLTLASTDITGITAANLQTQLSTLP